MEPILVYILLINAVVTCGNAEIMGLYLSNQLWKFWKSESLLQQDT